MGREEGRKPAREIRFKGGLATIKARKYDTSIISTTTKKKERSAHDQKGGGSGKLRSKAKKKKSTELKREWALNGNRAFQRGTSISEDTKGRKRTIAKRKREPIYTYPAPKKKEKLWRRELQMNQDESRDNHVYCDAGRGKEI